MEQFLAIVFFVPWICLTFYLMFSGIAVKGMKPYHDDLKGRNRK